MVHWYHAIFTAYGFWLPNDPRGSWSTFVASYELYRFGPATTTDERHSLASRPHDRQSRLNAKRALKYPVVRFDEEQRYCIADGIRQACQESSIVVPACAIGFDHVHVVTKRHEKSIEQVVQHFKSRATKQMSRAGLHPMRAFVDRRGEVPSPWAEKCWHVFIDNEPQLHMAIDYVQRHPAKEGLPRQNWPFITRLAGGPRPPSNSW
jgi:hypothetical protein